MEWDLGLEAAKQAIAKHQAKRVLIQLPDGLKQRAAEIVDSLKSAGAELFIWTDSNYGACDLPLEAKNVGVDLILHYGHEAWDYGKPRVSRPESAK